MNYEREINWRQYFAELVRIAIDKGDDDDLNKFYMGMNATDNLESDEEYEREWEEYFNERASLFEILFNEEFDYGAMEEDYNG